MDFKRSTQRATLAAMLLSALLAGCGDKPEALLQSAKAYLAKNEQKAAVIELKNALQSDPDLPEARFLLGSAFLESGDAVGAETELRKALELQHPREYVMPELAKALLAQGYYKKLIAELAPVVLSQPSAQASVQLSLASAYAAQGQTDLSEAALQAALQADPGYAPALLVQARQQAARRDMDAAMTLTETAIAKAPLSYEAWKLKADILWMGQNQPTQALAAYRKALELKPDFMAAHAALINMLLQQGQLPEAAPQLARLAALAPEHPQTKYLQAQLAFQKKELNLARDLVRLVLNSAPKNSQALQLAGAVEYELNAFTQAEVYLLQALRQAPELVLARRALVLTYLRLGQPAKALETILPGLKQGKVDPELWSLAGEVYLKNGDVKTAQQYLTQAAEQAPQDAKKRTSLALTHFISGSSDNAFQELEQIAASDTGTSADVALISAHWRRRDFVQALKAVEQLDKKQPNQPLVAHWRGRILLAQQDPAGARQSFERALTLQPDYFAALASLAALDVAQKHPELAKKRFEALLLKEPKNVQALLALAELAIQAGAPKSETADWLSRAVAANPTQIGTRLLLVDFYLRQQDSKAALSAAQEAVTALPDQPKALEALGRVQQTTGALEQATITYNKLAALQPTSTQPYLRLAEVQIAAKNREAASRSLRQALEIKPDLLGAQRILIGLALEGKQWTQALTLARTVQKQRPTEAIGYLLEGDLSAAQKNWDAAAVAYRSGLRQDAQASELAVKLHAVLQRGGKAAQAEQVATSWQQAHPQDARFLSYLGDVAIARKDYGAAQQSYTHVIKLQPDNAVAYNNLAWVSARLNQSGALAHAEKANTLAPNQPMFMDTLALLLSERGDYAKALELQQKTLSLQPKNALFRLHLAQIHLKGGNKELARQELQEISKLGSQFAAQSEVTALLKNL